MTVYAPAWPVPLVSVLRTAATSQAPVSLGIAAGEGGGQSQGSRPPRHEWFSEN